MLPVHYKNAITVEEQFQAVDEALEDLYNDSDEIIIPKSDEVHNGKVIAVTSSKGGSGKSTVSMVLAAYLAKASRISEEQNLERSRLKVCVVDFDTRDGQLGFLNGQMGPTVFNIIGDASVTGSDIPESAIKKVFIHHQILRQTLYLHQGEQGMLRKLNLSSMYPLYKD